MKILSGKEQRRRKAKRGENELGLTRARRFPKLDQFLTQTLTRTRGSRGVKGTAVLEQESAVSEQESAVMKQRKSSKLRSWARSGEAEEACRL